MGWTCDAAHTVCTLDAATLDYLSTLLQGVFFCAGALVGVGIMSAINALWSRL